MKEPKRGGRTESLSLRIDPKTKFILDFMVRITSIRITDLIEKAIKELADKTNINNDSNSTWIYYWHPDEGVRTMNLIMDNRLPTSYDEDEISDFIKQHMRFFFANENVKKPMREFIQVLWPNIDQYVQHWRDNKAHNRWATGLLMLSAIKRADMKGPDWPIVAPTEVLDDDIPF